MSEPHDTSQGTGSGQNGQGGGSSSYQPGQGAQHPGQTGGFSPAQPGQQSYPQPGYGQPAQGGYPQTGQPAYQQPGQTGGFQPGSYQQPGQTGGFQPGSYQQPGQTGGFQPGSYQPGQANGYQPAGAQQGGYGQPHAGPGTPQGAPRYPTPGGPGPAGGAPVGGSGGGLNKRLLAILGGILALLLIVIIAVAATHKTSKKPDGNSGASTSGSTGASASSGDDRTGPGVVQAYFAALVAGDAQKALSYAKTAPTDSTFLTDAVLQQAMKNSPITEVKATSDDPSSSYQQISYSYKLGGRQINNQASVSKVGDVFKMDDVAANVSVYKGGTGKLKELFNGVAVNGDKLFMFPGTYTVTTDNPYLTYGKGSFTVDSPNSYSSTDIEAQLTADGRKAYIAAAKTHLADCLKQKTLEPANCGFANHLSGGQKLAPNSVIWKIKSGANALDNLKGDLDIDDPTSIKDYVDITVTNTAKDTQGNGYSGESWINEVDGTVGPKGITVTFGS